MSTLHTADAVAYPRHHAHLKVLRDFAEKCRLEDVPCCGREYPHQQPMAPKKTPEALAQDFCTQLGKRPDEWFFVTSNYYLGQVNVSYVTSQAGQHYALCDVGGLEYWEKTAYRDYVIQYHEAYERMCAKVAPLCDQEIRLDVIDLAHVKDVVQQIACLDGVNPKVCPALLDRLCQLIPRQGLKLDPVCSAARVNDELGNGVQKKGVYLEDYLCCAEEIVRLLARSMHGNKDGLAGPDEWYAKALDACLAKIASRFESARDQHAAHPVFGTLRSDMSAYFYAMQRAPNRLGWWRRLMNFFSQYVPWLASRKTKMQLCAEVCDTVERGCLFALSSKVTAAEIPLSDMSVATDQAATALGQQHEGAIELPAQGAVANLDAVPANKQPSPVSPPTPTELECFPEMGDASESCVVM